MTIESTGRRFRWSICATISLGDDELIWYRLEKAGQAAIEKGDEPCRELLEHLDCNLFEQIKVDCGDNPQAMVEELLHHVQPLWMHDELDE
jgi:hypothetical protein